MVSSVKIPGTRVLRGPDWDQEDADGGEGHLGTVVGVKAEKGTAEVVWDNGHVTRCRVGKEGKHDLRIYDSGSAGECLSRGVVCQGCRNSSIYGTSWRCSTCSNLHLCSRCYHLGVHPLSHHFLRREDPTEQGVAVGTRSSASKTPVFGIFPEARVARGRDWQYGDIDGGSGRSGVVVEVVSPESGSARNAVRVSWDSGQSLQHRLGLHGKVDLVCTEEAPGSACYVSHLPVLALSKNPRKGEVLGCASDQRKSTEETARLTKQMEATPNASDMVAHEPVKLDPKLTPDSVPVEDEIIANDGVEMKELTTRGNTDGGTKANTAGVTTDRRGQDTKGLNEADRTTAFEVGVGAADKNSTSETRNVTDDEVRQNTKVRENTEVRENTKGEIGVGDRVEVGVDFDTFRDIQSQTVSWTDNMVECLGRIGVVKSIAATGEMEVDFEGHTWKINSISLIKATTDEANGQRIKEGDTVRIISDLKVLEELQQNHGGWNSSMEKAAGKVGKVKKVTPRGDVEVSLGQQSWVFNPQSCRPAPGCPTHLHSEDPMNSLLEALLSKDSPEREAMASAARAGDLRKIEDMLQRAPDLVHETCNGATPLHHAAYSGQTEAVRLLVARGSDINRGDSDNDPPLSMAIYGNRAEAARALIELGADVNRANNDGATPLHLATINNVTSIVLLLLQHNASVNAQDSSFNTPLFLAVMKEVDDAILDAILAANDLDLSLPNRQRATALHMAVNTNSTRNVEKILARNPTIVNQAMEKKLTAIHLAAQGKHVDIALQLIRAGAQVNLRDYKGKTPLHITCIGDFSDVAKVLVENGADLNATNDEGYTPLHFCVGAFTSPDQVPADKGLELAKYLIERGARTDIRNMRGNTAVDGAPPSVQEKLKQFIRSREQRLTKNLNADDDDVSNIASSPPAASATCVTCHQREPDVIFLPCAHKVMCRQCAGNVRSCQECGLVIDGKIDTDGNPCAAASVHSNVSNDLRSQESTFSKGIQTSEPDTAGIEQLFHAVDAGDTKQIANMVERRSALVREIHKGQTALHYAARRGQTEVVRLLVAKGADINRGDKDEHTPLVRAILDERSETARVLVELGADVNYVNARALTPLHVAVVLGSKDLVLLLLQHHASVNHRDAHGNTPLVKALAHHNYDHEIVDALLAAEDLDLRLTIRPNITTLHVAFGLNRTRAVEKILARDPGLVNLTMEQGKTALHIATQVGNVEVLKLLLKAKALIDAKDLEGRTALHYACSADQTASARFLVENGADVNATDDKLNTALHYSVGYYSGQPEARPKYKGLELAKFLIEHGARTDVYNRKGKTPLESAPSAVRDELDLFLRKRDGRVTRNQNAHDDQSVLGTTTQARANTPTCISCHKREADVVFLPCAHKLHCRQCAGSAKACQKCACAVEGKIDTDGNPVGELVTPRNGRENAQSEAASPVQQPTMHHTGQGDVTDMQNCKVQ